MTKALETLAHALAEAHRNPAHQASGAAFGGLDFDDAQKVQALTRQLLGETCAVSKVAIDATGRALAAPIYDRLVGPSGMTVELPPRGWLGLEAEIAVRLARPITPAIAERGADAVLEAIESFHLGVEIVGTRFDDRMAAGPNGPFADNMSTAGYVWSPTLWTHGTNVEGLPIRVIVNGETRWQGPSTLPFGPLLSPIIAYARRPLSFAALEAGMLVTTGTLCGLVELNEPGLVSVSLADAPAVTFTVHQGS